MRFTSIPFKLTAAALLLVASTGLAFAHSHVNHEAVDFKNEAPPCPCPPSLLDGFYVGAQAGYNIVTVNSGFDRTDDLAISGSPNLAAKGWNGGVFLGYGKYFTDLFYVGGEVFGFWSGASQGITLTSPYGWVSSNVSSYGSYGLTILPGLRINQTTLGYVRLGYVWSNVHNSWGWHLNTPPAPPYKRNGSGSHNNTISGWEWGVGMETLLVDNWSLRADATYVDYNSSNSNHEWANNFHPADFIFQAGVVYHFMF